jgi:hypothetical protein
MIAVTVITRLFQPATEPTRQHAKDEKGVEITRKKESREPLFSPTTGALLESLTMPAVHAINIISVLEPLKRTGGREVVNAVIAVSTLLLLEENLTCEECCGRQNRRRWR